MAALQGCSAPPELWVSKSSEEEMPQQLHTPAPCRGWHSCQVCTPGCPFWEGCPALAVNTSPDHGIPAAPCALPADVPRQADVRVCNQRFVGLLGAVKAQAGDENTDLRAQATELCEGHEQLWNDLGDETLNLPIIYLVDDSDKQFYCPILWGKHVELIRLHQNKKEKDQINIK